jgi:hypothetical protein
MDNSQTQLIKDKTFLEIREKVATILVEQNILDTHNGSVGWWVHTDGPTFISLYDVLEEARD